MALEYLNLLIPVPHLIIYAVQSTASSTVLSKQTDTVLPGKSSKIEVKYNMAVGPIRKTITVVYNAVRL
jgi:hypothetical protein